VSIPKSAAQSECGSIMIMALMIFLIISVLGTTIVEVGIMEYRSSHYEFEAQQSRQAADAGVDWGLELVYGELNQVDNLNIENLPSRLNCGNAEMNLAVDDDSCEVAIGEVVKVNELGTQPNACTYQFTSMAMFGGARRAVKVQVTYQFSGGYAFVSPEGNASFAAREYLDRGKIISYEPSLII